MTFDFFSAVAFCKAGLGGFLRYDASGFARQKRGANKKVSVCVLHLFFTKLPQILCGNS